MIPTIVHARSTNMTASESLLTEPEESVAYKQDPGRGQQGINDYDYKKARYRNDSKDARGQAQISCGPTEDSLSSQHNETSHENRYRKVDYGVENFRAGCQHCGRVVLRPRHRPPAGRRPWLRRVNR